MSRPVLPFVLLLLLGIPAALAADELTRIVQQDLLAQGYAPGTVDGRPSAATASAISRFQADHDLQVTGEVSVPLAGVVRAVGRGRYQPVEIVASRPATAAVHEHVPAQASSPARAGFANSLGQGMSSAKATPSAPADPDLRARQQACLEQKAAAAQTAHKKKRGFGRLMSAAGRIARRFAPAGDVARITHDVYDADATAADLSAAAKDLGLTEDEVEACRNPSIARGER